MAFSLLANTIATGLNSPITTGAIDTTGANLLVVVVGNYTGVNGQATVSDSKSNSWTGATLQAVGNNYVRIYYCASPIVGAGHTFTASNGGTIAGGVAVQAWSGASASPFDVENGAFAGSNTSLQTGSVTPSQANSLIIAGVSTDSAGSTFAIDISFTVSNSQNYTGGTTEGLAAAYLAQGAAASVNPAWSWSGLAVVSAVIAVFKPAIVSRPAIYLPGPNGPLVI